ncbi:type II toxin-antitoxin system VapC family toxin [Thermodesulfovibrio sp. TK110]
MIHILEEIENNTEVFIDANIFIYFFSKDSIFNRSCSRFFKRIENQEIKGTTNAVVIQEVIHRVMVEEAIIKFPEISLQKITTFLKNNLEIVKQLEISRNLVYIIENLNINVVSVSFDNVKKAQKIKKQYGFLGNDALFIETMFECGINKLATNDKDFEIIPDIHIYKPTPC